MLLLKLLDHISPEQYWFDGACYLAEQPEVAKPFSLTCAFLDGGKALMVEGTYRCQGGGTSHPFSIEAQLSHTGGPWVKLNTSHTGVIAGNLFAAGAGFEVLLSSTIANAFSCHLQVAKSGAVHASGAVKTTEGSFAFVANGLPGPEREALGNVVSLSGRRA